MDTNLLAEALLDDCARIQEYAPDVLVDDSPSISNAKYMQAEILNTRWFDEDSSMWRYDSSVVTRYVEILRQNDYYTTAERDSPRLSSRVYSIQYTQAMNWVDQLLKLKLDQKQHKEIAHQRQNENPPPNGKDS